jgi:hypothetical protein
VIEVERGHFLTSSLAHELAHVFETEFREPIGHCRWKTRGILHAIRAVSGEESEEHNDCTPWNERNQYP